MCVFWISLCFLFAWFYLCAEGGNTDSVLDVEKAVGTIIIAKPLDAEQYSFYNLTLQATDGINTAYTQVFNQVYTNSVHLKNFLWLSEHTFSTVKC